LVFGGSAARFHGTGERLFGRQGESDEIDDVLRDPSGPRLVLVRGERGVGRSAFVHAAAERLRAEGATILPVACVPGDGERPLLLALRIVMALVEHRPAAARHRPAHRPAHMSARKPTQKPATAAALSAVREGDRTAMAEALTAALARSTPAAGAVVVVVEDAQHADAESLALQHGKHRLPFLQQTAISQAKEHPRAGDDIVSG